MGVCYRSSYPSLSLNKPPPGAEPLVKEQTPSAAGAGLMMLWCHMSNLITCWVDWHFRWWLLATALQVVDAHPSHAKRQRLSANRNKQPTKKKKKKSKFILNHFPVCTHVTTPHSFENIWWFTNLFLKSLGMFYRLFLVDHTCEYLNVCTCVHVQSAYAHVCCLIGRQLLIIASTAVMSLMSP